MSRHAGVVRDRDGLAHLLGTLARAPLGGAGLDLAVVETTSLHTVCTLVAVAALARAESRGCHRRRDVPAASRERARHTVLRVHEGRPRLAGAVGSSIGAAV
jgi:L-aspartate oxidase